MEPGTAWANLKTIAIPVIVFFTLLKLSHRGLGYFTIPCNVAFIVAWAWTKRTILDWTQHREAQQLGVKLIPRVAGKWPGNIDVLLKMLKAFKTAYVVDVYLQMFEEYRCTTLNLYILWTDQIITMDHEHTKFVLATGFNNFWRGYAQKERMENFLGVGIFNRDDDVWKMHRSMTRPFFARERISDFEIFERHTSRTLSLLSSISSSGQPSEAQDLYARFTIDAASEFLFGSNLDTLSGDLPIPGVTAMGPKGSATRDAWGSFTGAFEMAQMIISGRTRIGWLWPLFEMFGDKSEPYVKIIRAWLDPLVRRTLDEHEIVKKAGVESSISDKTFLQHLVDGTSDPVLIRDQLLSMLLASRDTTACLLTFLTYLMATHPHVAERMRAEVLEHCGPDKAPTYDQIRGLKYMRAVLNETLRLFPPVPLNVRESRAQACRLPRADATFTDRTEEGQEYYMPGSTTIIYLPLLFQRNKALWGPDADKFDPERWLDPERVARFVKNPSIYGPFSAGPRICVGQNYAYNEASYFLVRLLQKFDRFTLAPEVQPAGSLPPREWKERKGRQRVEEVWPAVAMTLYVKIKALILRVLSWRVLASRAGLVYERALEHQQVGVLKNTAVAQGFAAMGKDQKMLGTGIEHAHKHLRVCGILAI
ncbi:hypothetical protein DXG01_005632 [Tephrocybe rancida]|nr:hypothetical protein DXG01_005632 [Tephrocybe rancida]